MKYYYVYDGKKIYGKSLQLLRIKVFMIMMTEVVNNMEAKAPIYSGDGKIAEIEYAKEINGKVYWCFQDCRNLRTFRSYYDLDQADKWMTKTIPVMEIFEMQGKQLLAKDVYEGA